MAWKGHHKLLRIGDRQLILLGVERIVVNGRDRLKPTNVRTTDLLYFLRKGERTYLSVRTAFVNRYRATWHDSDTQVAESGPFLRGHLIHTIMCDCVLHCCDFTSGCKILNGKEELGSI
jgi:hypothetical protein